MLFALKKSVVLLFVTYSPAMADMDGSGSGSGSGSGEVDSTPTMAPYPHCSAEQILLLTSLPEATQCMMVTGGNGLQDLLTADDAMLASMCKHDVCQDLANKLAMVSLPQCDWNIDGQDTAIILASKVQAVQTTCLSTTTVAPPTKPLCTMEQSETLKTMFKSTSLTECVEAVKTVVDVSKWNEYETFEANEIQAICDADKCVSINKENTDIPDCVFSFSEGNQGQADYREYMLLNFKKGADYIVEECKKTEEPTDAPTDAPTDEPTTMPPSESSTLLVGSFLTVVCMLVATFKTM